MREALANANRFLHRKKEKEVEILDLKNLTFRGGVHPDGNKDLSNQAPITRAKEPALVSISMHQHTGAPCEPTVQVGDTVKIGQIIGNTEAFVSAPIHASISGTVKEITTITTPTGMKTKAVVIENDGREELGYIEMDRKLEDLSADELKKIVRDAGITGLGGASFPAHVKFAPPADKPIDSVIINGSECEPYLTADQLTMQTWPEKIIRALEAILKILGAPNGYIVIEDNKPEAIKVMQDAAAGHANIQVAALKTKYPQGDEKRVIDVVLNRQVPSGGLPMDVGAVVSNVSTAIAVHDAVYRNKPLYERVITLTGHALAEPKNLIVKMGTPLEELIEQAGGFRETPGKIISGGPMMGMAQPTLHTFTIKGMGGLLVLTEEEAKKPKTSNCINCARCVEACPVRLEPLQIERAVNALDFDRAEAYRPLDCIECGACSYTCPAKRPLVEAIRLAKYEIRAKMQKAR